MRVISGIGKDEILAEDVRNSDILVVLRDGRTDGFLERVKYGSPHYLVRCLGSNGDTRFYNKDSLEYTLPALIKHMESENLISRFEVHAFETKQEALQFALEHLRKEE